METIACLGSSSTAGKGQAFNWLRELSRRPANRDVRLLNFGVGGDLAVNALQRVPKLVEAQPDRAIVWVGGNDALAMASDRAYRLFKAMKALAQKPSPDAFEICIVELVQRLRATGIDVALCSLGPIGEAPGSTEPLQAALNRSIADLSARIRRVADTQGVSYIPVHEALSAAISAEPGQAFAEFRLLPFYRDAFRTLILRMPLDKVGALNGWKFHTDGVHLNRRGGMIAADLIQAYLDSK